MTHQISLLLICVVTFLHAYSQIDNRETSLSLSIGAALPVGHFTSTQISDKRSGFEKAGETVNFSLLHQISKKIGVIGTLYGQRNGLNTNALAGQFSQTSIPFYYNGGGPNTYTNWSFDKKSWYVESFLAGLTDKFFSTAGNRFSCTAKMLIGVADVRLPASNGTSKTDTSFVMVSQNSASAVGFSYMGDIGLDYKFQKNWSLLFSISYFGTTTINFKKITETLAATNGGLNSPGVYALSNSKLPLQVISSTSDYKQPIGVININFGIGLHL